MLYFNINIFYYIKNEENGQGIEADNFDFLNDSEN